MSTAISQVLEKYDEIIDLLELAASCNSQRMRNSDVMKARQKRLLIDTSAVDAQNTSVDTLIANYNNIVDQVASLTAQVAAKKSAVALPDLTIPAASLITLQVGEKTFSELTLTGIKPIDLIILVPKNMPVGYGLRGWSIPADNKITVKVQCPILSVGGTALVFGVTAFR